MKKTILLLFLIVPLSSFASAKIPVWFYNSFKKLRLSRQYELNNFLRPTFLSADFNGDGNGDIAALIINKKSKKRGILIIHQINNKYFIIGAGTRFGNGGNDFRWAKGWKLYKNKVAHETLFDQDDNINGSKKVKLKTIGFYIYDLMDGEPNSGGIIHWNGAGYIWTHTGE